MRRALALVALAACDVSFPDEFLIEDLRVLDLQVEPPEVGVFVADGSLALDPMRLPRIAPGRVRITALVAHPDLDASFGFDWIKCGPGLRSVPCEGMARTRLTQTPTRTLELSVVDALLADVSPSDPMSFATAFSSDPRDLISGLNAHLNVAVSTARAEVQVDTAVLEATKRVVVFEPRIVAAAVKQAAALQPGQVPMVQGIEVPNLCIGASAGRLAEVDAFLRARRPNRSPELERIEVEIDVTGSATRTLGRGEVIELAPSQRLELRGVATSSSAESYTVLDANCELQRFEERLGFSWFISQGSLSRQLTTETRATTVYTAPNAADLTRDRTRVRVWLVLRDGRGGSTHTSFDLAIVR